MITKTNNYVHYVSAYDKIRPYINSQGSCRMSLSYLSSTVISRKRHDIAMMRGENAVQNSVLV